MYCHPVEMIFVNVGSMMAGPVLLASHPCIWGLWGIIATTSVALSHSGYVPEYGGSVEHDLHHQRFDVNYGIGFCLGDRLFGSYYVPQLASKDEHKAG